MLCMRFGTDENAAVFLVYNRVLRSPQGTLAATAYRFARSFFLAHRYRSAPAVRFVQTKISPSFWSITAFSGCRGITQTAPDRGTCVPLREPRFYPQKYGAFSANFVNVTWALSYKKKARTSETWRDISCFFTHKLRVAEFAADASDFLGRNRVFGMSGCGNGRR